MPARIRRTGSDQHDRIHPTRQVGGLPARCRRPFRRGHRDQRQGHRSGWNHVELRAGPFIVTCNTVPTPAALVDKAEFRMTLAESNQLSLFDAPGEVEQHAMYGMLLRSRSNSDDRDDRQRFAHLPGSGYLGLPAPGLDSTCTKSTCSSAFPSCRRERTQRVGRGGRPCGFIREVPEDQRSVRPSTPRASSGLGYERPETFPKHLCGRPIGDRQRCRLRADLSVRERPVVTEPRRARDGLPMPSICRSPFFTREPARDRAHGTIFYRSMSSATKSSRAKGRAARSRGCEDIEGT